MANPVDKAAVAAGVTIGVIFSVVALVMLSKNLEGCNTVTTTDSTATHPDTTVAPPEQIPQHDTLRVHDPMPDSVVAQIDSLRLALAETHGALADALWELQRNREDEWEWRWEKRDSLGVITHTVIGMAQYAFCPTNGLATRAVWVDSLITPEHIRYITKTVFATTGIDFYWLPVAFILGALAAAGLYAWVAG